jgi:lactoylglutathione lyase
MIEFIGGFMKNLWTTIQVKNMEESIGFYTTVLDLVIDSKFSPMSGLEITFLGDGETKLELIYNTKNSNVSHGNSVSTGFLVDSVDEYISKLKEQGIKITEGPFAPNPSIKYFFIEDPNGYRIQLVEQRYNPE